MASAVIGALRVLLSADTANFSNDLNKANRASKAFSDSVSRSFARVSAAIVAVAGPAALGLLVKSTMDAIGAQVDLANRVGSSVAALQTLEHAAGLAGVSQEALAKTLEVLNARLGEAARTGAGPTAEALDRLGLSAQQLISLDADERIGLLADRFKELGFSAAQQGDALRQLGIRTAEVINLLQDGSPAIEAAREELDRLGVTISDVEASRVEAAGDAWDRIGKIFEGIANQLTVELAPYIEAVANLLVGAAKDAGGFGDAIKLAVAKAGQAIAGLLDALQAADYWLSRLARFQNRGEVIGEIIPSLLGHPEGLRELDAEIESLTDHIEDLERRGPPSAVFERWMAEAERAIELSEQAAEYAEFRRSIFGDEEPAAAFSDPALGARIDALREHFRDAREVAVEAYEIQRADLDAAHEAELIGDEAYHTLQAQLLAEHQAKLAEIDAQGNAARSEAGAANRAAELLALQESLMTEQELEAAEYARKLEALDGMFAEGIVRQEEYNRLRQELEAAHLAEMKRLRDRDVADQEAADAAKRQSALSAASAVTGALSNLFEENKGLAIATALINTYEAVTRNLAKYEGPLGVAFAAAALANGLAQVRAITSTSKNSKGGSGGGLSAASAPGFGAAGGEATGASVPSRTLFVTGINPNQLYSGDAMRGLAEALVQYQRDGGEIVLK